MEAALNLPEILIAIFKYLVDAEDLASAACVNPAWNRWAVDAIWMTKDVPIQAVLELLGPCTKLPGKTESVSNTAQYSEEAANNVGNDMDAEPIYLRLHVTTGSLSPTSIQNYLRRSKQLKGLKLEEVLLHQHTIDTLQQIAQDGNPPFPQLQHIHLETARGVLLDTMNTLLGPNVTSLRVDTRANNILEDTLDATLVRPLPISNLTINSPVFISQPHLLQLPHLTELVWQGRDPLSTATWRILASSWPLLKSLDLNFTVMSRTRAALQSLVSSNKIVFPRLEVLALAEASPRGGLTAIFSSTFPSLRSLTLRLAVYGLAVRNEVRHIKKDSHNLTELEVYLRGELMTFQTLNSLSSRCMTKLDVHCGRGWLMRDEELDNLVAGLPHLEVLRLKCEYDFTHGSEGAKSGLTMWSLLSLARHCMNLHDIIVSIKAAGFDASEMPEDSPVLSLLKTMGLGIWNIGVDDDVVAIARYVAKLCPRAKVVEFHVEGYMDSEEDEAFTEMFWAARRGMQDAIVE